VTQANSVGLKPTNGHSPVAMSNGKIENNFFQRAKSKLEYIHYASNLTDLLVTPSNRLHALKGDRKGQHSISINDQWRICFRFVEGDAFDVEITDYH
jgi:proteic killer suppression protein